MKKILLILVILTSLEYFTQDKLSNINLNLDKYDSEFKSTKDLNFFIRPSTPYLYLVDELSYPYYEPTIYPKNFNPIGNKYIITFGIKYRIFK